MPAERTTISIIIPARNEAEYIEMAISSVAIQGYPLDRLECIVVENGSTDDTARRVKSYADRETRFPVSIVCEPVAGVGRAKNAGAAIATGDILVFLDADSRMSAGLARDVTAEHGKGCEACSIRVIADSDVLLERGFFALMEVGKRWFGVRAQMLYCDRSLFLDLGGFDPALMLGEDVEFLNRVKQRLRRDASGKVGHICSSWIATSPRRLRAGPYRLGMLRMFGRWALAFAGLGRSREY